MLVVSLTRIVVKYHNRRMLLTVDTNALFAALFDAYDGDVTVEFVPMNEMERHESTEEVKGLRLVRERFQVFEGSGVSVMKRRPDIEQAAITKGVK
jgi:hypothetical protein